MYVDYDNSINNISINNISINRFKETKEKIDKSVINKIKKELIDSGKYDLYCGKIYAEYSKYCSQTYGTEMNKKFEKYLGAEDILTDFEKKLCKQIYDSRRKKISRLRHKLEFRIANYDCLWLTLTFTDDILNSTSELTRRRYIQRFLKDLDIPFYTANIDYGDKEKNSNSNEREHYHAIIQSDYLDMSLYNYGFVYVEKIHNTTNSIKKISTYINKLTSHAYKDSTKKQSRLIYSRNKKVENTEGLLIPYYGNDLPF